MYRFASNQVISGPFYVSSHTFHQFLWYLSACLPVTYISFTQYWNVVESLFFEEVNSYAKNGGVILRSKGQRCLCFWWSEISNYPGGLHSAAACGHVPTC